MLNPFIAVTLTAGLLLASPMPQPSAPGNLSATLAKLDASSAHFTSAEAHVHREQYDNQLKMTVDSSDGKFYLMRAKGGVELGMKIEGSSPKTLEYKGGTIKVQNAACYNTITKPGVDTYLTLGFGASGKDLAKAWTITDNGSETLAGTKVEKLDLVALDPAVRQNYSKISLWVDLDRDVSLKQVFYSAGTGGTNTATYTNIVPNKSIDTKPYAVTGKPCK